MHGMGLGNRSWKTMFAAENIQNLLNMYLVSGKQEALDVSVFLSVVINFHVSKNDEQLQKQIGLLSESGCWSHSV